MAVKKLVEQSCKLVKVLKERQKLEDDTFKHAETTRLIRR